MAILIIILVLLTVLGIYLYFSGPALPPETDAVIEQVMKGEIPPFIVGETGFASSNGLQIWYENILPVGSPKATILLLMSMGGDSLYWPPAFVRALVNAGYQVIRYDHRGTGLSDWVRNWDRKHPYTLQDMANDAISVLDKLDVKQAHLIGLSMGGMIAQEIGIHYPARVASLTLMMTSGFIGDPDVPGLTSEYFWNSLKTGLPLLKYRLMGGEKNLIKERIAKTIIGIGYEGLNMREIAELVVFDLRKRKGVNLKALLQHQTAVTIAGSRFEKLKSLPTPTLVIHGTGDQFIPIEHGKKLVDTIPNAKGIWLDGVGHIFPVPDMEGLVANITAHLETSQRLQNA